MCFNINGLLLGRPGNDKGRCPSSVLFEQKRFGACRTMQSDQLYGFVLPVGKLAVTENLEIVPTQQAGQGCRHARTVKLVLHAAFWEYTEERIQLVDERSR